MRQKWFTQRSTYFTSFYWTMKHTGTFFKSISYTAGNVEMAFEYSCPRGHWRPYCYLPSVSDCPSVGLWLATYVNMEFIHVSSPLHKPAMWPLPSSTFSCVVLLILTFIFSQCVISLREILNVFSWVKFLHSVGNWIEISIGGIKPSLDATGLQPLFPLKN